MLKINKLEIEIIDENGERWGNSFKFSNGLSVIIGENTVGKSTIINSIYYCLGLEELLGYRDVKALKPVLRDKINIGKYYQKKEKEVKVSASFIKIEIENKSGRVVTLKRNVKSIQNEDCYKIISVYEGNNSHDYFLDKNSVISEKGFFNFLEKFLEINLPQVLTYKDNNKNKLYLQNIFSAFFIEQLGGWSDFIATIPTYYKIIHPKRRIIEFILGLECNNIILKRTELENLKNNCIQNLKVIYEKIKYLEKSSFILVDNFDNNYKNFNKENIKLNINQGEKIIPLELYLNELNKKLNETENMNYIESFDNTLLDKLKKDISHIQSKLIVNQQEIRKLEFEISNLIHQKENFLKEKEGIFQEIKNFKDIQKLNKFGSIEKLELKKCPYCDRKMNETLYSPFVDIMDTKENIKYLEEKSKILTLSNDILLNKIDNKKEDLKLLNKETKELFSSLTILTNDLPQISFQKEIYRRKFNMDNELFNLKKVKREILESIEKYSLIINKLNFYNLELESLPKNNLTNQDKEKLQNFKKDIIEKIKLLKMENNNLYDINISEETYLPKIADFNIRLHISASDFIRLEWAYYIALAKNSIFKQNILIFDEPAQQNIAFESIENLFKILNKLENTQSIVSYAVSKEDQEKIINFFKENNIPYFLIENASIKKLEN